MDSFIAWLAYKLPKRLTYWAAMRVMSYATVGQYSDTIVPELKAIEALQRWK